MEMLYSDVPFGNLTQFLKTTMFKHMIHHVYHRKQFRSQTSDNMDRWKSRGGKSQGGEEKQ